MTTDPAETPSQAEAGAAAGGAPTPAVPPSSEPSADHPAEPGSFQRLWREWIRPLLIVLVVMGSFRSALADWNDVPSGSMKPTIVEGDRIFVNKAAYGLRVPFTRLRLWQWGDPARGDIVVLFSPDDDKRLVKRVVGLPGDSVAMRHGRLYINGQAVQYEPIDPGALRDLDSLDRNGNQFAREELGQAEHPVILARMRFDQPAWNPLSDFFGPIVVPPHSFFVMGDNRPNSRDSRFFGVVDRSRIVGKATAVVFSLDLDRHYRPRWDRFFQRLH